MVSVAGGRRGKAQLHGERAAGVSAGFLHALAGVLRRMGEDATAFLAALGLTADAPDDTYVDGARVDAVLERIAARRADRVFGLSLARAAAPRPLGLLGHVMWLSETLGEALERAVQLSTVTSQRMLVELERRRHEVVVRQRAADGVHRGVILTEFTFAAFVLRARAATDGRFQLGCAQFRHAGRTSASHHEIFGAPVLFDAGRDALVFSPRMLTLPLANADRHTASELHSLAQGRIAQVRGDGVLARLEAAIRRRVAGRVTLSELCEELGHSERTLRRELQRRGTSFRALRDRARLRYVEAALARGRPMKAIAAELGFAEPSVLSRAYKRWTGAARHARR
ncbi:MAG: AraC family transcriptional regulator [Nannocystaceae bacterium]|nr:AraC family transcriptional regulator [Nannocystaceae bacterium]